MSAGCEPGRAARRYLGAAFALTLAGGTALAGGAAATPLPASPGALCRAAVQAAEREARLPPQLLAAIALVESGRPDPGSGSAGPWPWTINAEGGGQYFDNRQDAVTAVRDLLARGVRLIDVGCLQVNLHHHPTAFASLEDAFDPLANARYAAGFLRRLQAASGDWVTAAGLYHSGTAERAEAYRLRVLANWPAGGGPALAQRRRLLPPSGPAPIDPAQARRDALAMAWQGLRAAPPAALPPAALPPAALSIAASLPARGRRAPDIPAGLREREAMAAAWGSLRPAVALQPGR
ncbi:lytic transglycosylase domain-containing protein [Roseomonas sp. 18066]|uniref:lytic transglycosylase domain-containing protein n=1 Tax=Roseomonas sp. 18066 TaxID=2681412 RepID=UPI00135BC69D|nr:lytic transglycosylase domain-containing protein [Roseomonas sp. 18066]